jgi:class 3 adenylate cyclase/tetratricopeptide (TPR) repeat protein
VYLRPLVGQTSAVSEHSERKLATVLFADLAGSTALADDQDPERTRARLERFYDAMAEEIQTAGGTVEKFAGDAVMAAFGAPEALEDHAERALHAALSMQRRLESMFGSELALRIGVNTGEVVVGRARADSSFVSGDAVNVAARLEEAAVPGEILAGERTVSAARGAFEFGQPRTAEAKGKAKGVACRTVVRALSLMRTRGVGGLARAFVGRDAELERLYRAYRRAVEESHPVLVSVLGDAGVGKTRLMRELWERLSDERPEPLRRVGRCLAYGQAITYWPLAEVLKEHFSILENDSPDQVRRRLGERELLGLTLGLDVAGDLHPLAARDRLHAEWVSFLSELTAEGPLVVLIEDVHWGERPLLDLIERVARDVRGPLLVLVTSRPDLVAERTPWGGRVDSETIWLEPLPDDAATSLVESLLAGGIPSEVRELIVEHAEGNPFFVEELLGSLIDSHILERVNGSWRAGELPPGFQVPDSVQAVLAARIDLLDDAEKAALQAASVIGRVFWTAPVYELVEGHEPDLHVLESRDLIRQRSSSSLEGEVEYVFKHALTREVAYSGLTKARRARLHAQFGAWVERFGAGRDDHAPLLAHHYAEAVRPEDADLCWSDDQVELARLRVKAGSWLMRAAELAVGRYEIDDGLALLHRALELEPDEVRQSELWRKVGLANALKFDGEAFWTAMQRSLAVCTDSDIAAETYADLALQTVIRSGIWPERPNPNLVQGWIEEALRLAAPQSAARAKGLVADCFWNRTGGGEAAKEANAIAERLGDIELLEYSFAARGWLAFAGREFAEALTWSERSLELVDEIDDPDHLADLYENAIPAFCGLGRFDDARRFVERHRAVVEGLTPHHRLHGIAIQLEIDEICGTWDDVLAASERTADLVEENLSTPCIRNARSLLVTALAAAETGDPEWAEALERRALEVALEGYDFVLASPRARLALARGDVDAALGFVPGYGDFRMHWALTNAAVRLDTLVAAGASEEIEREAPSYARAGTYTQPFALRALGIVRNDEALVEQAQRQFAVLRLGWHADQTETLRRFRKLATG